MRYLLCFVFILSNNLYAQNYYSSINDGSSQLLRSSLHNLIDNHNVVSYESCKQHLQYTDSDPNDSGNIILIYKQNSVNESWDGGDTWNREHVWAASYGLYDNDSYSVLHNLKPADTSVTSSKGNKIFITKSSIYVQLSVITQIIRNQLIILKVILPVFYFIWM